MSNTNFTGLFDGRFKQAIIEVGNRIFEAVYESYISCGGPILFSENPELFVLLPFCRSALPLLVSYLAKKAALGNMIFLIIPVQGKGLDTMRLEIVDFEMKIVRREDL